jgi:hypothetical protein
MLYWHRKFHDNLIGNSSIKSMPCDLFPKSGCAQVWQFIDGGRSELFIAA